MLHVLNPSGQPNKNKTLCLFRGISIYWVFFNYKKKAYFLSANNCFGVSNSTTLPFDRTKILSQWRTVSKRCAITIRVAPVFHDCERFNRKFPKNLFTPQNHSAYSAGKIHWNKPKYSKNSYCYQASSITPWCDLHFCSPHPNCQHSFSLEAFSILSH